MSRQEFSRNRLAGLLVIGCLAVPALARAERPCSVQDLAGEWMFATAVGRQAFPDTPEGDITALGTMNLSASGTLAGTFDVTVETVFNLTDVPYSGSFSVGEDCRGTLSFVTGQGSSRTDSIVVVGPNEFLGMSQDTNNLWTYQARRISRTAGDDVLAKKVDALMRRLGLVPEALE